MTTVLVADAHGFEEETRVASPANLLIKIESFSLFSKYGINKYESKPFEAGGYKWKLIIYPEGYDIEDEGCHVSVYLSIAETGSLPVDWEVNAMFTIFLYNFISDNYLCFRGNSCRFHAISSIWGSSKLISKEMLLDPYNGYLVEDKCVFGVEVFVVKSQRAIECVSLLRNVNAYEGEWIISDILDVGDPWCSDSFCIGDYSWRIKLYPYGYPQSYNSDGCFVSILLVLDKSYAYAPYVTVNVAGCFRIRNNLYETGYVSRKFSGWCKPNQPIGVREFVTNDQMVNPAEGFLVDNCCFVEAEISVLAVGSDYVSVD